MKQRKIYFIDSKFQGKFIFRFCSVIIFASLLTGFLVYMLNRDTTTVAFENLRVVVKSTSDFIMPVTGQILLIVSVFSALSVIYLSLHTSHKISGPLYNLHREIIKIKNRDLTSPIHIRATDQLKSVSDELEEMRASLKSAFSDLQKNWDVLSPYFEENIQQKTEIKKSITEISQMLNEIKTK